MNKNLVSLFAVAFVVALMATGIFYGLFIGNFRQPAPQPGANLMVVAKHSLERGTVLKEDDVKTIETAPGQIVPGAVTSTAKVQGLTVLEPVQENSPILESFLTGGNSTAGSGIAKGMRVTNVHVGDSSGVIAMLRSGQRVDVQVVTSIQETRLRTILQNIEVLNVPAPENGRSVVNLLVTPEEADLVGLADAVGRIRLVLRNPKDSAHSNLTSVNSAVLLRDTAPATRSRAASAPAPGDAVAKMALRK
jgi:Flp pilus assembly protein CpaB